VAAWVVGAPMTTEEIFSTHTEPAWRDRANFVINARLAEEGRFEQLWVRQLSDDTFELCCIPFFLYDVALGDVVQTEEYRSRRYVLAGVLQRSGHYVFRAYFGQSTHPRHEIVERLTELGATIEWSSATCSQLTPAISTTHNRSLISSNSAQSWVNSSTKPARQAKNAERD
jgi:hypothetical protein